MAKTEVERLRSALLEAEAGLELAVARLDKAGSTWDAASEREALRIVRKALAATPTPEAGNGG